MFGGWAWLLDDHLLCEARDDGMLVRLGKGDDGWALEMPDVVPMISRGRQIQGWVRAGSAAYGNDPLRRRLLDAALFLSNSPWAEHSHALGTRGSNCDSGNWNSAVH